MRHFLCAGLAALLLSAAVPASAQGERRLAMRGRGVIMDDVALNGAAAARTTDWVDVDGWSSLTLHMYFTYDAATSIDIVYCEGTGDLGQTGDATFVMAVSSVDTSGTVAYHKFDATLNDDGTSLAADFDASVTIGVQGHRWVRCVLDGGGVPTASDKLTVRAAVSVP